MKARLLAAYLLAITPSVHGLSLATDVAGWAAGKVAGACEHAAAELTAIGETARWIQCLSRCSP